MDRDPIIKMREIKVVLDGVEHDATLEVIRPQMNGEHHFAGQDVVRLRVLEFHEPLGVFGKARPLTLTMTRMAWASVYDMTAVYTDGLDDPGR